MEDFYTALSFTVFQLMGFEKEERNDDLYHLYIETTDRLCESNLNEFLSQLNTLAMELYAELLAEKKLREKLRNEEKNYLNQNLQN